MKKLAAASCLAACLALAAPAISAVQTFGPDAFRFTLDVPDGWTAAPRDDGCQLTSADGKTGFTLQVRSSGGRTPAELADVIRQEMTTKLPQYKFLGSRNIAPDHIVMDYVVEVDKVLAKESVLLVVDGDRCFIVVYTGPDEQGIANIIKTGKHVR